MLCGVCVCVCVLFGVCVCVCVSVFYLLLCVCTYYYVHVNVICVCIIILHVCTVNLCKKILGKHFLILNENRPSEIKILCIYLYVDSIFLRLVLLVQCTVIEASFPPEDS